MTDTPTLAVPISTDEHGVIRVSGTRVTLDSLLNYYLQGETPEDLHDGFSTVPLADIYSIIAYYLNHRDEIDRYLERRRAESDRARQNIEADYPPEVRARHEQWRAALAAKRRNQSD